MPQLRTPLALLLASAVILAGHPDAGAQSAPTAIDPVYELPTRTWARTLTLDDARKILRADSIDLQILLRNVDQAGLLDRQAAAILLPSVSLNATYTLNDDETSLQTGNPYAPLAPYLQSVYDNDPALSGNPDVPTPSVLTAPVDGGRTIQFRHDYRIVGTVQQPVFNARAFPALDLARLAQLQASSAIDAQFWALNQVLTTLWFDAVTYQRQIEIGKRNVDLARLNRDRARAGFEEKVTLEFELNRAEAAVKEAVRNLQNIELAYLLTLESIAVVLNTDADFDIAAPAPQPAPDDPDALLDRALAERPDLKAIDVNIEFQNKRLDEIDARFWPVVSAQAQAFYQRASAFGGDSFRWALSISANWLIYDSGMRSFDRDTQELEVEKAELQRRQAARNVDAELRRSWLAIDTQRRVIQTSIEQVDLARRNVELVTEARRLGTATALDVDQAQQSLFLAELALAQAEVELQRRIYELWRIGGELR